MVLRCENNKTNAYIATGVFLGSKSVKVTTRLDKNKAQKKNWNISTDHETMFARKPILFIKNLVKHKKLLFELTRYSENQDLMEFDIQGLSEVIKPLREACNW